MTQAISAPAGRLGEWRIVAPVCAAHFVSHYYMIILAPLFAFIRADYGVSYTDLALALTAFNVVSAVLQTPAGFLVDHIGARIVLMAGVALGAAAFAVAGLVHSFAIFVAMFAVAGLGNTAYHPANYSLLSQYTPPSRIGQDFLVSHLRRNPRLSRGAGDAPGCDAKPFRLARRVCRRNHPGAIVLALLIFQWPAEAELTPQKHRAAQKAVDGSAKAPDQEASWRMLLSPPIMLNLGFFILISIMGGLNTFLVVASGALYGTPDTLANVALTGLLSMNAVGVLVGGYLASRTTRHVTVAALSLALAGIATLLMGTIGHSAAVLITMSSLSGLFAGVVSPSRDMLVRSVTPPGAFGRVFGFVSSGFNIGSMIAPMIYGILMDHGEPRAVFLIAAACSLLSIGTVVFGISGRGREQR